MSGSKSGPQTSWDKHVAALTAGGVLTGGVILPIQPEGPASKRNNVM
jgi:hypothetical protein